MAGLFLVRRTDGTIPGYEPHGAGGAAGRAGESQSSHEH